MRKTNGTKNDNGGPDLPLQIWTTGWEIPTNEDILAIIDAVFENEDRIYPRPKFKGAGMFFDEIVKHYAKHIEEYNKDLGDWI